MDILIDQITQNEVYTSFWICHWRNEISDLLKVEQDVVHPQFASHDMLPISYLRIQYYYLMVTSFVCMHQHWGTGYIYVSLQCQYFPKKMDFIKIIIKKYSKTYHQTLVIVPRGCLFMHPCCFFRVHGLNCCYKHMYI